MSTQIKGTAIRKVTGAMVTDDGRNVLIRLEPVAGPEVILAFPSTEVNKLILLAAQSATGARAKTGVPSGVKDAFRVEDWQLHLEPEDRVLVLSLKLAGQAELSFLLPVGIQQPLIDQLASTLTPPATDPSQIN